MTALRAGSYDAAKPIWRGVIRGDKYPCYVCMHRDHASPEEARQCARAALPVVKTVWLGKVNAPLPEGWRAWHREVD